MQGLGVQGSEVPGVWQSWGLRARVLWSWVPGSWGPAARQQGLGLHLGCGPEAGIVSGMGAGQGLGPGWGTQGDSGPQGDSGGGSEGDSGLSVQSRGTKPWFALQLLAQCFQVVLAAHLGKDYSPEMHAAFDKFMSAVAAVLAEKYR